MLSTVHIGVRVHGTFGMPLITLSQTGITTIITAGMMTAHSRQQPDAVGKWPRAQHLHIELSDVEF
jgi:hypothetical protein